MINCNLNQFETMSMCTGCRDWKMPKNTNTFFLIPEDFKSLLKVNQYQYASNNVNDPMCSLFLGVALWFSFKKKYD